MKARKKKLTRNKLATKEKTIKNEKSMVQKSFNKRLKSKKWKQNDMLSLYLPFRLRVLINLKKTI